MFIALEFSGAFFVPKIQLIKTMEIIVKRICFYVLVSGFIFGLTERFINADLFSVGFAGICACFLVPLCPDIKTPKN
jgi:hypothetical protein